MVKRFLFVIMIFGIVVNVRAQYQLFNSDFEIEEWDDVEYSSGGWFSTTWSGIEPKGWNSFLTGTGDAKSTALGSLVSGIENVISKSTETYDKNISKACVQLKPYNAVIKWAQANLTNGCINMGGTDALDWTKNYNYTNVGTDGQYGNFRGKPDKIHVWVKFNSKVKYGAKVSCVLHDANNGGYMQDPYQNYEYVNDKTGSSTATTNYSTNKSMANVVAHASKTDIQSSDKWQELFIDMIYDNPDLNPSYALVTFATSSTPGEGDSNDVMWVDDFEFIYNSELASAEYAGTKINFSNGTATVDALYDESKLKLTSNGKGASIETSFSYNTSVLTITVSGNDISDNITNKHIYTIQFAQTTIDPIDNISDDLFVTVNSVPNDPQSDVAVTVEHFIYDENNYVNFILRDFLLYMNGSAMPMPVGNIEIYYLKLIPDGDWDTFTFNGTITLKPGSSSILFQGMTIPMKESDWQGPSLGPLDMTLNGKIKNNLIYVTISISIPGQEVEVAYGYDFKNYTLSSEYGTICIPTAAALPDGVKAYSCASVTNSVLDLVEVSALEANTPYILQKTGSEASYTILTTEKTDDELHTAGCLTGVLAANKTAPSGSYVLQNLDNNIAFYQVNEENFGIPANRCYLTTTAPVKALVFPDGTQTSISEIQAADEKAVIYDLSGRRVSKATKGIYIINGKKVIK